MYWKTLSKEEASHLADEWNSSENFMQVYEDWDDGYIADLSVEYQEIRNKLEEFLRAAELKTPHSKNERYNTDIYFALSFYDYLKNKWNFTAEKAANDGIWRYIQMKVVPRMVFDRWTDSTSERINSERFWKNTRRIWLKSLWWYIHLSLQNDSIADTEPILLTNNIDTISQLVERSGVGYRIDLYREIMRRLYISPNRSEQLLRKVMKLNTVRCATIEPLLAESGIVSYVNELFSYFEE